MDYIQQVARAIEGKKDPRIRGDGKACVPEDVEDIPRPPGIKMSRANVMAKVSQRRLQVIWSCLRS